MYEKNINNKGTVSGYSLRYTLFTTKLKFIPNIER